MFSVQDIIHGYIFLIFEIKSLVNRKKFQYI